MEKLILMTDFLLEQVKILIHGKDPANIKKYDYVLRTTAYARFLKQPLELWMFIPCDDDGNVLKWPKCNLCGVNIYEDCGRSKECGQSNNNEFLKYQQAKERCLFEGFKCSVDYIHSSNKCNVVTYNKISIGIGFKNGIHQTIEDLVTYELLITPKALKQIGL
jgi:hypothetical protein